VRDACLSFGTDDEATFHQLIANSALHLDRMQSRRTEPRETHTSIRHQTRALRLIREKLANNTIPTDNMIKAVVGLLGYDVC
jgi:hypothetical protein